MTEAVAADRLRSFVQRVERLDEEIKALNTDKSEIYKEAENEGFDKKALKEVVRRRSKDQGELQLFDATVDTYLGALGERKMGDGVAHAQSAGERIKGELDKLLQPGTSLQVGDGPVYRRGEDGKVHAEAAE